MKVYVVRIVEDDANECLLRPNMCMVVKRELPDTEFYLEVPQYDIGEKSISVISTANNTSIIEHPIGVRHLGKISGGHTIGDSVPDYSGWLFSPLALNRRVGVL